MRNSFWLAALSVMLIGPGCAWMKKSKPVYQEPPPAAANPSHPALPASEHTPNVRPAEGLSAKVTTANSDLKFVVLTFPINQMARVNQHLNVYRAGLKVGELNVTGPQLDNSILADITAGEAKPGDEVRDN